MAAKKARKRRNGKKTQPKRESSDMWPVVAGLALLVIAVTALVVILRGADEYPVQATVSEALSAFRTRNVSELIIYDISTDFASGNYTIKELGERYPGFEQDIDAANTLLGSERDEVIATVNGEPITRTELRTQLSLLPPDYKDLMGEDQILAQMIDERLLVQEAARLGISPTAEMVDQAYIDLLQRGDLTEQQLQQNVASYGLELRDIQELLKRQLIINMLFNETVREVEQVTEEEIRAFYDANPELFVQEPEVTVRHILIPTGGDLSGEEVLAKAESLFQEFEAGAEFCDLVTQESADLGSKENCGEYTFGRGFMVPEFEEASFRLSPGAAEIVQTQFGYHIVLKVSEAGQEPLAYEEVRGELKTQLESQKRLESYQAFIESLRTQAEIITDFTELPEAAQTEEATPGDVLIEVEDGVVVADNMAEATEPENKSEEPVLVAVQPTSVANTGQEDLGGCLTEVGAVLYTSSWAPHSLQEADRFENPEFDVVDCSETECPVSAFPAWEIAEVIHLGSLSNSQLWNMAGCE